MSEIQAKIDFESVVTHDLHSALSIGTRIAMLHGGKIIELSTPEEFIESAPKVQTEKSEKTPESQKNRSNCVCPTRPTSGGSPLGR